MHKQNKQFYLLLLLSVVLVTIAKVIDTAVLKLMIKMGLPIPLRIGILFAFFFGIIFLGAKVCSLFLKNNEKLD